MATGSDLEEVQARQFDQLLGFLIAPQIPRLSQEEGQGDLPYPRDG
jgi:hypothetical protein